MLKCSSLVVNLQIKRSQKKQPRLLLLKRLAPRENNHVLKTPILPMLTYHCNLRDVLLLPMIRYVTHAIILLYLFTYFSISISYLTNQYPPFPTFFTIIKTLLLSEQTMDLDTESATNVTSPIKDNTDHNDQNYNYKTLSHTTNWSNQCLCPMSYLKRCVRTALVVLHEECVYQLWSSNFEVYSAGMLRLNLHSRITRAPTNLNDLETATFVIPENDPFHVDENDVLHVYRNGSPQMNRHVMNLQYNIALMARVIMEYGVVNTNRKSSIGRIINFGVAAEYGQTTTIQVKGQHFFRSIPSKEKAEFFHSILSIGQLIWKCASAMQVAASKPPLATDNNRDSKFASVLRKYMIDQVGASAHFTEPWEWYTLSIMLLFPCFGSCNEYDDKKNYLLYAYSKTVCANFIIKDKTGNIYLL